jgi:hypothetical protein
MVRGDGAIHGAYTVPTPEPEAVKRHPSLRVAMLDHGNLCSVGNSGNNGGLRICYHGGLSVGYRREKSRRISLFGQ